jgi:hypothetical protein
MYVPHPVRGYTLAASFCAPYNGADYQSEVCTNGHGLREREVECGPTDATRILVLGDSFAFGAGVEAEQALPRQIETVLRSRMPEQEWEVINAGVPGYGTDQELALLDEIGALYAPDIVVLALFAGNDVSDNAIGGATRRSVRSGYLYDLVRAREKAVAHPVSGPVTSWLALHSRFYVFVRTLVDSFAWQSAERLPVPKEHLDALRRDPSQAYEEGMAVTETLLLSMEERSEALDATFLVVVIPSAVQVDDMLWENVLAGIGADASAFDRGLPARWLGEFGRSAGINVLSLRPVFLSGAAKGAYYAHDIHWTARGHAVAAQAVAQTLLDTPDLLGTADR